MDQINTDAIITACESIHSLRDWCWVVLSRNRVVWSNVGVFVCLARPVLSAAVLGGCRSCSCLPLSGRKTVFLE